MTPPSLLPYAAAALCAILALAALLRHRRSLPRWAFALGMAALAGESLLTGVTLAAADATSFLFWRKWEILVGASVPGIWLLFSLGYARGNAGEFVRRWRWGIAAAFAVPLAVAVVFRGELIRQVTLDPVALRWGASLSLPGIALHLFRLLGALLVLMNVERTFRASAGTMRWRIKYMLLGLAVLFTVRIYSSSQVLLFRSMDQTWAELDAVALLLAALLMMRTLLRTGHFELDVYPSHAVLAHSVTVVLAGAYLLAVGIAANWVSRFGGDGAFPLQAFLILVSLVFLAVVLQSDHVRLYTRRFVSRHFQRPSHDYLKTWREFSAGTAACVDPLELGRVLANLVADTFHALTVTVWLADERNETLTVAASTARTRSTELAPCRAEALAIVRRFRDTHEPVDIDLETGAGPEALRRCNPSEFPNGGHRICVPLHGSGELLGLIAVGDRVAGATFTFQDLDLLKCIAHHAAASLRNARLSGQLLQSKELEAFQSMATFFVHDLKNSASTLNLTVQNLPVHFDDPAFREDAVRGIAKTVARINQLIGRLNLLRQGFQLEKTAADLNEVVARTLAECGRRPEVAVTTDFQPGPALPLDADQFGKVVTNLILNAQEAIGAQGAIRVSTRFENGWARLAVADNGCGIDTAFRERNLFRPFQTTKKQGLGIGMFQSKTIVEAHGGRIDVDTALGQGTTFTIWLPTGRSATANPVRER